MTTCTTCRFENREADNFCGQCGSSLAGARPPGAPSGTYVPTAADERTYIAPVDAPIAPASEARTLVVDERTVIVEDATVIVESAPRPSAAPAPGDTWMPAAAPATASAHAVPPVFAEPVAAPPSPPAVAAVRCPAGHANTEPGGAFCGMCGLRLDAGAEPPRPSGRPEGTVLQGVALNLIHRASGARLTLSPGPRVLCLGTHVNAAQGDWDLWELTGSAAVSRRHLLLLVAADGGVSALDAGSRNGTFVNGQRLDALTPRRLQPNDVVTLGQGDEVAFVLG